MVRVKQLMKFAPNATLTSEMGWIRPQSERYICMLRFWNRLLNQPDTAICKKFSNKTIIFVMEIRVQNLRKYVNY